MVLSVAAATLQLHLYLKHMTTQPQSMANTWQTFPHTATALPLPHGTAQPPPLRDRDNHVLTNSHSHVTAWEPIT